MWRSRRSTSSNSLLAIRAPTNPMASTGPPLDHVVGKLVDPLAQRGLLPVAAQLGDRQLDQVGRPLDVAGGQRVPDRRHRLPGLVVPAAGAPVQLARRRRARRAGASGARRRTGGGSGTSAAGRRAGRGTGWPGPAAPASPCRRLAGHGVAQRAGEPVQDGGLEQEPPHRLGLPVEDLLDEVVDDEPVVAGEPGDEPGRRRRGPAATARPAAGRRPSPRCAPRARRRPRRSGPGRWRR